MVSYKSYTPPLLGLSLLMVACGSDPAPGSRAADEDSACDQELLGESCDECDDGETGTFVCKSGELSCQCAPASTSDDPKSGQRDAGKGTSKDASQAGPRKDASTPPTDAGTQPKPDASTPSGNGPAPTIPEPTSECPELKSGTATIGGLADITLEVGAKKSGGPLVFYWHGTGTVAAEYKFMLPQAVQRDILDSGGIIVSPQGTTNKGSDCSGTGIFKQGDFEIMDLIAACAVKNNGIDPRKIYTTGCSAGGLQATCMGALRSSYIAAAAPNSGGQVRPMMFQDSKHTPSLMTMHGGSADNVGVSFATTSKAADDAFKKAGGFVMNCNHNGDHCRAPAELQTAAWEFMKAHPFGVDPEPDSSVPDNFPDYCTIY
ncbi:MAG TPA: prolyl oligopeptidase family serine peptidase [Polyangiales bacterium]